MNRPKTCIHVIMLHTTGYLIQLLCKNRFTSINLIFLIFSIDLLCNHRHRVLMSSYCLMFGRDITILLSLPFNRLKGTALKISRWRDINLPFFVIYPYAYMLYIFPIRWCYCFFKSLSFFFHFFLIQCQLFWQIKNKARGRKTRNLTNVKCVKGKHHKVLIN